MSRTLVAGALAAGALAALPAAAAAKPRAWHATVVVKKLNNPRQLAVGPRGVYVAEAGRGGPTCVGSGEDQQCYGATAAVGLLRNGAYHRVATGLFSGADASGIFATGADAVAVDPFGRVYTVITSAPPAARSALPAALRRQLGRVVRLKRGGGLAFGAAIDAYEAAHDPDHQGVESDPYGIAATRTRRYVADAAGNDVLATRGGKVRLVAVLPNIRKGVQAVPTSLAIGPDGALYVGELGGDGAKAGDASVWRIAPGRKPRIYRTGFSSITGIAFGPDRSLYVSEFQTKPGSQTDFRGAVIRVDRSGHRTRIGYNRLFAPGGVTVDRRGRVYVSNYSVLTTTPAPASLGPQAAGHTGELVRFSR